MRRQTLGLKPPTCACTRARTVCCCMHHLSRQVDCLACLQVATITPLPCWVTDQRSRYICFLLELARLYCGTDDGECYATTMHCFGSTTVPNLPRRTDMTYNELRLSEHGTRTKQLNYSFKHWIWSTFSVSSTTPASKRAVGSSGTHGSTTPSPPPPTPAPPPPLKQPAGSPVDCDHGGGGAISFPWLLFWPRDAAANHCCVGTSHPVPELKTELPDLLSDLVPRSEGGRTQLLDLGPRSEEERELTHEHSLCSVRSQRWPSVGDWNVWANELSFPLPCLVALYTILQHGGMVDYSHSNPRVWHRALGCRLQYSCTVTYRHFYD